MSEIKKYRRRISLGPREEQFLGMIIVSQGSASAYSIYSELNDGETDNGKARKLPEIRTPHTDSMSYKNVHKRIKRLQTLELIEPVQEQKQKGKEIKYKPTSRGLFQELLGFEWYGSSMVTPLNYKDDIIIQTILYRYFEFETIEVLMEIFGPSLFHDFVTKCCEEIQQRVEGVLNELEYEYPRYYSDKKVIASFFHAESPTSKSIDEIIRNEARNLIPEIVRECAKMRYNDNFPNPQLLRDEKFKELLEEAKNEFYEGYRRLHFFV